MKTQSSMSKNLIASRCIIYQISVSVLLISALLLGCKRNTNNSNDKIKVGVIVPAPIFQNDIIGKWSEDKITHASYVLYRKNSKVYMRTAYYNGEVEDKELIMKLVNGGTRYDEVEKDSEGDYYVVDPSGNLFFSDSESVNFASGSKIQ